VRIAILVLLAGLVAGPVVAQSTPRPSVDPLLGLKLPASARFTAAPVDLVQACPALANARWDRRLWVFAQTGNASTAAGEFLVVGGELVERAPEAPAVKPVVEADKIGVLLLRTPGACRLIGPPREVFDYGEDGVTPATLDSLAQDAARRYAQGLGGQAPLRKALKRQRIGASQIKSAALRQAFFTGK
jgi:hypothetical protein